jgi:hypothetical protein
MMAEELPDAPWANEGSDLPDAPWAMAKPQESPPSVLRGMGEEAARTTKEQAQGAWENIKGAATPFQPKPDEGFWAGYGRSLTELPGKAARFGKGVLGAAGLPFAPVVGAGTSLVGREVMAPIIHKAGEFINPEVAAKETPESIYQDIRGDVGSALSAAKPKAVIPGQPPTVPPNILTGKSYPAAAAERQAAQSVLNREGIDYTAGQLSGKKGLQYKEAMAGVPAEEQHQKSLEGLTRAISKRIGEDTPNIHEAVQTARPRIGQAIEESSKKLIVRMDPELMKFMQGTERDVIKRGLSADERQRIAALRDNVMEHFDLVPRKGKIVDAMQMHGESFHNAIRHDSDLSKTAGKSGVVAEYAQDLKRALMDAAERTANRRGTQPGKGNRKALEDFQNARHQWANLLAIEDVASSAGPEIAGGLLNPSHVRRLATFREKSDYARGRGDFNDLAKASNLLLTPLPNSGSAQRLMATLPSRVIGSAVGSVIGGGAGGPWGALTGAGMGAATAPWLQGRAIMSRPLQGTLKRRWEANQARLGRRDREQNRRLAFPLGIATSGLLEENNNPYAIPGGVAGQVMNRLPLRLTVNPANPYAP